MKAALFVGGWQGHRPEIFCQWATELLQEEGFEVEQFTDFSPLLDPQFCQTLDLVIPLWSSARSSHQQEFGSISRQEELALLRLVAQGCGLAGWHGHMGDAFRDHPCYHFMIGGQFVAHPPGWPDNRVPSDDFVEYRLRMKDKQHPITAGIDDLDICGEQYYMLVAPDNHVLAESVFSGEYLPWIANCVMPVIWTRNWASGRVFYCSLGHTLDELRQPSVECMIRRGMHWARRTERVDFERLPATLQQLLAGEKAVSLSPLQA